MENHACRESRSVTSVRPTPGRTPAPRGRASPPRCPAVVHRLARVEARATRERRYRRAARARATRATSRSHVAVVDRGTGTERPRRRPGRAFVNLTRLDPVRSRHSGRGAWGHAPCEFPCPHAVRVDTQRRFPPRTRNTRRRDAGVTTRTGTARRHHTPHTAIPHRHGRTHVHPQDDSDTRILDVLCYAVYYDGRGGSFGLPELGSRRSRLAARAACALARGGSERCRPVSGLQRTSPCPTTIAHKAQ